MRSKRRTIREGASTPTEVSSGKDMRKIGTRGERESARPEAQGIQVKIDLGIKGQSRRNQRIRGGKN